MKSIRFDPVMAAQLGADIRAAEARMKKYLEECFPKGARCRVRLSSVQANPTPATIVCVSPSGRAGSVLVNIDTAKPGSRLRTRTIPASMVVTEVDQ